VRMPAHEMRIVSWRFMLGRFGLSIRIHSRPNSGAQSAAGNCAITTAEFIAYSSTDCSSYAATDRCIECGAIGNGQRMAKREDQKQW